MSEETKDQKADEKKEPKKLAEEEPVVKSCSAAGIKYDLETGRLPIFDNEGEIDGLIFYHYYKRTDVKGDRPLIVSFNGGPGSPSLWLHLGALGPKRVKMQPHGDMPPPPFDLVDNPANWLEFADLVFIDPVGTGFSRAKDEKTAQKFWGLKGDIEATGEFIRLFLTRKQRWTSPLYLAGESYGTTRASGVSGYLAERGIVFNGIILVSSIINFQTARFVKGNDLPYALFLPTYTATGHFHGKVSGDLQDRLAESRKFALCEYWLAMAQGSNLPEKERAKIRKKLSQLTGLTERYLDQCDLRPVIHDFTKELLRDERRSVGRLDSRFRGLDDTTQGAFQRAEHDPSMSLLMGPYVALYCQYCRAEAGYETDLEYHVFRGITKPWDWGSAGEGHPDVSDALRKAMSRNPYMGVFVASGYYDLATPFFATEYTLSHLGIDPVLHDNIEVAEYEAGHMMYINEECLSQLRDDVAAFVKKRSRQEPRSV
ncbi:MAG: peptidase S10 [Armatimonadetes bacterium]|nr:peptidase S10 [Armatimonadota bacterium]